MRAPALIRQTYTGQSMNGVPAAPQDVPEMSVVRTGETAWENIHVGGSGWQELMDDPTHMAELTANARNLPGHTDILVMNGGQGDVLSIPDGVDGATAYARAVTYAGIARGLGYHYIVGVTWPAYGPFPFYGITEYMIAQRLIVNELTLADGLYPAGPYNAIADGASGILDDPFNLRYYELDQVHLELLGGTVLAERISTAILTLPPFA